jgi:hypothetical protein
MYQNQNLQGWSFEAILAMSIIILKDVNASVMGQANEIIPENCQNV